MQDAGPEPSRLPRRSILAGALGLSALEVLSLGGRLDNWRAVAGAARALYTESLAVVGARDGIVHVGHSTHLICVAGMRMLTDPWFYDPAFGALDHAHGPAVAPAQLERLDAILVSHEHPDHADFRAMDQMDKRAVVVVATEGLAAHARRSGFREAHVLRAWESLMVGPVRVHAVPALHDVYEVGFVVEGPAAPPGAVAGSSPPRVYFAGDTRLHPELEAIAERFRPTFAILPVDGTRIRTESLAVMTPEDAVTAARRLRVRAVMPSHAEAVFVDPLAEYVLAANIPEAARKFAELASRDLPGVTCFSPEVGGLTLL